jgi:prefoldin subunit 5
MDKLQKQSLVFVIILGVVGLLGYSGLRVDAMTVTSLTDDSSKEIKQLTARIAELEKRMEEFASALKELKSLPDRSTPDNGAKREPQSDDEPKPPVPVGGEIVITVDAFSKIPDNLKLLAEADELKGLESADNKEIARLKEQSRKLLDALKELENRDYRDRSMTDVEYRRLMQENTNQRSDISNEISGIKEKINKRKYLENAKRREAVNKGQKIEGHFGTKHYIVFTKLDCSKIVAQGANVLLISPKSIRSSDGVEEYEVSRVELASVKK